MQTVKLAGTPEEIGRVRAREERSGILFTLEFLLGQHGIGVEQCVAWAQRFRPHIQEHFPDLAAELDAQAAELGLAPEVMFAYGFRAWNAVSPTHQSHPLACYNILFRDQRAGPLLGGVVEDMTIPYVLEDIAPAQGYRHFSISLAGSTWTVRGMNERGLAGGQVTAFPGKPLNSTPSLRYGTEDYSRNYFLLRRLMQTGRDVKDAAEAFTAFSALGTFLFADRSGDAICVEKAGAETEVTRPEGNVAVTGGHFQSNVLIDRLRARGIEHVPYASSNDRQRAVNRLAEQEGPTLALLQRILTSHTPEEGNFCTDWTRVATIAVVDRAEFLVTGFPPCETGFTTHRFQKRRAR